MMVFVCFQQVNHHLLCQDCKPSESHAISSMKGGWVMLSWKSKAKGSPPLPPPQANKTFIRPSYGMLVVNPLIRPCFLRGGGIGGYP